jgi:hypothetical protein
MNQQEFNRFLEGVFAPPPKNTVRGMFYEGRYFEMKNGRFVRGDEKAYLKFKAELLRWKSRHS